MSSTNAHIPPNRINQLLPALHHALSGSLGTLFSTCALYPLSLVITRLQVQHQLRRESQPASEAAGGYDGIVDAFSKIWKSGSNGGGTPRAFYIGLGKDAAKSVLDSFLFFLFYEWFRSLRMAARKARGAKRRGIGLLEDLAVGVAAGACSRALTTPIANIVTRQQTAGLVSDGAGVEADRLTVRQIASDIRREKGLAGFWAGYSASLVLTLNPSITFFLQEALKKSVVSEESWDQPGTAVTFLLSAVSKAIASTVTYPFSIAKTRLQVGIPADTRPLEEDRAEEQEDTQEEESSTHERDVDKEVDDKLKALRAVQTLARRSIFGTVAQIVRTEGLGSLYTGIQGELIKGFFSHGTTMVAKDFVHKLLFKFYLFTAALLTELKLRRLQRRAHNVKLPVALQYRLDRRNNLAGKDGQGRTSAMGYGVNIVANLIDGTMRELGKS
ncbi:mitochondrial carrier domain-containing protein [Xylariomycetidae sp. FL2044]|nr:mitochondrial carrier domain-containing protein [Xylariomycetidae sp. FL2044]